MWRLLLDQLRRSAALYFGSVAFIALIWVLPSETFSARWVVAWSLVVACFAGSLRAFTVVSRNDLRLLPVSWQARWRAQWMLAIVVPLAVIALGQLLGAAIAATFGLPRGTAEAFLLSLLFSAAYLGFAAGVWSIFRRQGPPKPPTFRPRNPLLGKFVVASVFAQFALVVFGGLSGFIFYKSVPGELLALRSVVGGLITVGIGTAVWTWFFWSGLGSWPYLRAQPLPGAQSTESTPLPLEPRGATGVRGLFEWGFVKACRHALVCAAIALPFLFLVQNRNLVKVFWVAIVLLAGGVDWVTRLRPLRQLPLSVLTLNLAMLATTVTLWVVTGLLMSAAAFIAPSSFDRIPFIRVIAVVIGVSTLIYSVSLRNKLSDISIMLAVAIAAKLVPKTFWAGVPSPPAEVMAYGFSLAAIAVAVLVNHRTLTRSSAAYKSQRALDLRFLFRRWPAALLQDAPADAVPADNLRASVRTHPRRGAGLHGRCHFCRSEGDVRALIKKGPVAVPTRVDLASRGQLRSIVLSRRNAANRRHGET